MHSIVLNSQKETMLENAELRERMILKDMHIGELKEVRKGSITLVQT